MGWRARHLAWSAAAFVLLQVTKHEPTRQLMVKAVEKARGK